MLKALRRWLDFGGRLTDLEASLRAAERRAERLHDDLEHLETRHEKLRGRVTGGLRASRKADEDGGNGTVTPRTQDEVNALIRAGRGHGLLARRFGPDHR